MPLDVANGLDDRPVTYISTDSGDLREFRYIASLQHRQVSISGATGCRCQGRCDPSFCPCSRLVQAGTTDAVVSDCGSACGCDPNCGTAAKRLAVPLQLRKGLKGWSAHTQVDIASGTYVAQYVGEVLNSRDAEARLQEYDKEEKQAEGHALLVVREYLPSGSCLRLNIDATKVGNVARFFNHSCDGGNLQLELVRPVGELLPRVCLFASRDISAGEELTFAYGLPNGPAESQPLRHCMCGSESCLGFLPHSQ